MKKTTVLIMTITALLSLALVAGCGKQTDQANQLVDEASQLSGDAQQKVTQTETLILQASDQQAAGQTDAQKATLTKIKALNDEILAQIAQAKAKTDQAVALNISDSYRRQLQASSAALDAASNLFSTQQEMVTLLLGDPALDAPGSRQKYNELQARASDQRSTLEDADAEARRLAQENANAPN